MALFASDYDQVQVGGEFTALPAGGYVCIIKKAQMTTNSNGLPMVEVRVDIFEGKYKDYFIKLYRERVGKDPEAKWPYNGVLKITAVDAEGHQKKNFKSFCTAVEQSNGIERLPRHDDAFLKALVGKGIGVLYGREEYEGNDGKAHWSTKPKWFRSVQNIRSGNFTVPEDKPLENTYGTGFSTVDDSAMTDMFGVAPTYDDGAGNFNAPHAQLPF